MKIAVCDDSREDRGALRALLEACGHDFEIREYGSGEELYADMGYVRECGIVFLDINMEGMDGLEAAGRIKAECPKVHIVLVTACVNYALDGYKVKASCRPGQEDGPGQWQQSPHPPCASGSQSFLHSRRYRRNRRARTLYRGWGYIGNSRIYAVRRGCGSKSPAH